MRSIATEGTNGGVVEGSLVIDLPLYGRDCLAADDETAIAAPNEKKRKEKSNQLLQCECASSNDATGMMPQCKLDGRKVRQMNNDSNE